VYLTYNSSTGVNCVVTHKTAYHGTATWTGAAIWVGNLDTIYTDEGRFSHYAVVKASARGKCVAYAGYIRNTNSSNTAHGGRETLGNCG